MPSGIYKRTKPAYNKGKKGLQIAWNKGKKGEYHLNRSKEGQENFRKLTTGIKNTNYGKFGKNHPCYKENKKNPFYKLIRETFKYRQWRSDIFTKNNFTCVFCGEREIELNADHFPKRFIDIVNEYKIKTLDEALNCEELWNLNNGRTLCVKCHRETDTWGRQKTI